MSDEGAVLVESIRICSQIKSGKICAVNGCVHTNRYTVKERVLFATCNVIPDGARK